MFELMRGQRAMLRKLSGKISLHKRVAMQIVIRVPFTDDLLQMSKQPILQLISRILLFHPLLLADQRESRKLVGPA